MTGPSKAGETADSQSRILTTCCLGRGTPPLNCVGLQYIGASNCIKKTTLTLSKVHEVKLWMDNLLGTAGV